MTGVLLGLISMCFVLSLIVVFHEFGHFITAKKSGVLVREFSIGFGPLIYGKTIDETNYCARSIPLGGYVDLAGMDENEELADSGRAFYNKGPWVKMTILLAGSFMNFVLAFLIYWGIFSGYGVIQDPSCLEAVIASIAADSPAAKGKMIPGDKVVKINDQPIETWGQMLQVINQNPGTELKFTVSRNTGEIADLKIIPELDKSSKKARIGVSTKNSTGKKLGIIDGAKAALNKVAAVTAEMAGGIKSLIFGSVSMDAVQGPLGIAKIVKDQAAEGFLSLMLITALLSINIGLFNLFPIPGLDGGRIIFTFLEAIRRRRLSTRVEEGIHAAGIFLLLAMAVLVTYKDIMRLAHWN